jgi:protein disulfide-isomerase A1
VPELKVTDDTVFIAYLEPDRVSERAAFADMANRYWKEFTFGIVSDSESMERERIEKPTVVCHRNVDNVTETFLGFDGAGSLENFILEASRRVIGEMTPFNQQRLLDVSNFCSQLLIAN